MWYMCMQFKDIYNEMWQSLEILLCMKSNVEIRVLFLYTCIYMYLKVTKAHKSRSEQFKSYDLSNIYKVYMQSRVHVY